MLKHVLPITRPVQNHLMNYSNNKDIDSYLTKNNWEMIYDEGDRKFIIIKDSGIFLEIDRQTEELLTHYNEIDKETDSAKEVLQELQMLIDAGVFEKVDSSMIDTDTTITSLNLNINHSCNLRCLYCFADGGSYGMKVDTISKDMIKTSLDKISDHESCSKKLNVVLFGGEPLIRRDLIEYAISYGREIEKEKDIEFIFDIFTNGTLIDQDLIELMKADKKIRLLISLDGPPEINDKYRPAVNGKKVSEIIEEKMELILQIPKERIVLRSTVADIEPDLVGRVDYFLKLGFQNIVFDVSYCLDNSIIPHSNDLLTGLNKELHKLATHLIILIKTRQRVNINLLSENISQILMNQTSAKSTYVSQCPAGRNYLSVDTSGDIYPCHFFVGNETFKLGNIVEDGIVQKNMSNSNGISNLEKVQYGNCHQCSFINVCEGPCPYKQLVINKGKQYVSEDYCNLVRRRFVEGLRVLASVYRSSNWPYLKEWNSLLGIGVGEKNAE